MTEWIDGAPISAAGIIAEEILGMMTVAIQKEDIMMTTGIKTGIEQT